MSSQGARSRPASLLRLIRICLKLPENTHYYRSIWFTKVCPILNTLLAASLLATLHRSRQVSTVDGGGYGTQFILFSETVGQPTHWMRVPLASASPGGGAGATARGHKPDAVVRSALRARYFGKRIRMKMLLHPLGPGPVPPPINTRPPAPIVRADCGSGFPGKTTLPLDTVHVKAFGG